MPRLEKKLSKYFSVECSAIQSHQNTGNPYLTHTWTFSSILERARQSIFHIGSEVNRPRSLRLHERELFAKHAIAIKDKPAILSRLQQLSRLHCDVRLQCACPREGKGLKGFPSLIARRAGLRGSPMPRIVSGCTQDPQIGVNQGHARATRKARCADFWPRVRMHFSLSPSLFFFFYKQPASGAARARATFSHPQGAQPFFSAVADVDSDKKRSGWRGATRERWSRAFCFPPWRDVTKQARERTPRGKKKLARRDPETMTPAQLVKRGRVAD